MFSTARTNIQDFRKALEWHPESLSFIAFDLLHVDGDDLRPLPLIVPRSKLWPFCCPFRSCRFLALRQLA